MLKTSASGNTRIVVSPSIHFPKNQTSRNGGISPKSDIFTSEIKKFSTSFSIYPKKVVLLNVEKLDVTITKVSEDITFPIRFSSFIMPEYDIPK